MELSPGTTAHGFEILRREDLPEIDGTAFVGRHAASGARLLYLQNDDNNKSFSIGFRTPPKDDTGVFHILEHSVLCGSRRFPVKEPFVDLLKGSMQTFLNAMTFADKTLYPVASTNEQDLFNLMDVYLDAVFHPRIYDKRQIFQQEGWHYELHAADGSDANAAALPADRTTLVYNGVVYNEMKGALSDANSVLYDEVQKALFPGTCYAFESGGTPAAIPTLEYDEYLDEHRRHYRTDNSYLVLYGNLDADRALAFLDEQYLTPVAEEQHRADEERRAAGLEPLVPREITRAQPTARTVVNLPQLQDRCGGSPDDSLVVAVPEGLELPDGGPATRPEAPFVRRTMDTAAENACAACGYVLGEDLDRTRSIAVEVLLDALFGSNEAPLKRALLDQGIAHDVNAFVSDAVLQPFAMVQVNMPAEGAGERLADVVRHAVEDLLDAGIDHDLVSAALSNAEFQMREHDFGTADGVVYAMTALSSWLYDDEAATDYLRYERTFAQLHEALDGDYFERLCAELFLDNVHTAAVEIAPTPGVPDYDASERLAQLNRELSAEDRARIVADEALLRDLQEAPDDPEAVATLPRLSREDIGPAPEEPRYDLDWKTPLTCVRHGVATHGIAYAYRYYDLDALSFEDLPYAAVLGLVLGKLGTAHRSAAELDTLAQEKLGNFNFFVDVLEHRSDPDACMPKFVVSTSALSANSAWLATLPREVLAETDYSDAGKILDILKQRKITMEQAFTGSGHACATARVKSYYTRAGVIAEQLANVDFYRFLCNAIESYDERAAEFAERLQDVASRLFRDNACTVSFAGSDDDYDAFWLAKPQLNRVAELGRNLVVPTPAVRNEAFVVPSDVCYAALGWDSRLLGLTYDGSWAVAGRALSLDYLWNEVRVKGGAYGVGFQARVSGNLRFYSYRDPHLDETLERFARAVDWLAAFDPSDEEMDGFVVATVAGLDAPVKPRSLIRRQMTDFFRMRRPEERRQLRDQMKAANRESIREFARVAEGVVDAGALCVFGNREILESASTPLQLIPLVG